mmetsp:Transcript_18426/g.53128  ORF Transcript_18426/g.53128 Transcript_18426/m.53128 type:complete len:245 (+) Transcript_18426:435-1169(+)
MERRSQRHVRRRTYGDGGGVVRDVSTRRGIAGDVGGGDGDGGDGDGDELGIVLPPQHERWSPSYRRRLGVRRGALVVVREEPRRPQSAGGGAQASRRRGGDAYGARKGARSDRGGGGEGSTRSRRRLFQTAGEKGDRRDAVPRLRSRTRLLLPGRPTVLPESDISFRLSVLPPCGSGRIQRRRLHLLRPSIRIELYGGHSNGRSALAQVPAIGDLDGDAPPISGGWGVVRAQRRRKGVRVRVLH